MDNDKGSLQQAHISIKDSIKDLINIRNRDLTVSQQCLATRTLEKRNLQLVYFRITDLKHNTLRKYSQ